MAKPSDLFREEVFEARKHRLFGEVILSQPLSTKIMAGALCIILAIAAIWVTQSSYTRIETVRGILVTDQPTAKVFVPQPGIVVELSVADNDTVRKGQRLAVIKLDRQAESGRDILSQSSLSIEERLKLNNAQIGNVQQRMSLERSRLGDMIRAADQQISSLDQQIELQAQIVESNQQIFKQLESVVDRGFVSKVEYERRRQTWIASKQQFEALKQQRSSQQSERVQAQAQITALPVEEARNTGDIKSQQSALVQQKLQVDGDRSYVITAPVSGRVTAIQTATGRAATVQSPLLVIVPQGSKLRAELYAPTRAVGFVKIGQETRILFDAFPYQRFGSFSGKIKSISKTIFDPRETDVPIKLEEAVYKITVELDQQYVTGFGEKITLQPGMTLNANVILERQSFLDWILTPLNAVRKRTS